MTDKIQTQTLYMDTELSGADYIEDYANLPGVQGPLWGGHKIPVLGVCGEILSGKTTYLLDIARGPVTRVDLPGLMVKSHTNGWKPIDIYLKWLAIIREIPIGRFRVIALDVSEEIEAGIADWVWQNPTYFGHTLSQYTRMSAMYQGDVSSLCKTLAAELASKCETFAYANHIGLIFDKDGKPTGEKKNKGRPVFKQICALYLRLAREKDAAGNVTAKPSAIVEKARLRTMVNDEWVPILPPRIPVATPASIREYILHPPNYSALKPEERAPDRVMTDDERIRLQIQLAQEQGNAERLHLERLHAERQGGSQPTTVTVTVEDSREQQIAEIPTPVAAAVQNLPNLPEPTAPPAQVAPTATAPITAPPPAADDKAGLREAITAAVHRLNLSSPEVVTARINADILAVNEGVPASLGRLGVKKLAAILERLTGGNGNGSAAAPLAPTTPTVPPPPDPSVIPAGQPATLQEALASEQAAAANGQSSPAPTALPPTNGHAAARPRPTNKQEFINSIRDAWEELAHHMKLAPDVKIAAFAPLLSRYGTTLLVDLNDSQLAEVEGLVVGRLRTQYAVAGLGPCPF